MNKKIVIVSGGELDEGVYLSDFEGWKQDCCDRCG